MPSLARRPKVVQLHAGCETTISSSAHQHTKPCQLDPESWQMLPNTTSSTLSDVSHIIYLKKAATSTCLLSYRHLAGAVGLESKARLHSCNFVALHLAIDKPNDLSDPV